jgi:hypothetical protein
MFHIYSPDDAVVEQRNVGIKIKTIFGAACLISLFSGNWLFLCIGIGIGICQIKDKQIILFSLETAWVQE